MSVVNLPLKDSGDARVHTDAVAEQRMFRRPSEWLENALRFAEQVLLVERLSDAHATGVGRASCQ